MDSNLIRVEAESIDYNSPTTIFDLQKTDTLKKLLIEDKEDLVLFGEGNYTFSMAIAVLRQSSWEGMTVTCFEKDN